MLGGTPLQRAQIEQWMSYCLYHVRPNVDVISQTMFGAVEYFQEEYNQACSALKEQLKNLNSRVSSNQWLVGSRISLADLLLGTLLVAPYSTLIETNQQTKAYANVTQWFETLIGLPSFVASFGHIKFCTVAMKPPKLPSMPKKEVKKEQAAPKPKPAEEKKPEPVKKDGPLSQKELDQLPPSPWNFFDFKTLIVNHKDKAGGGMAALKE